MKFADLLQFAPVTDAIRLDAADQADLARDLVAHFLISPEMAARLTGQVFPRWQIDRSAEGRALLVVGARGTGKSHLLATLSSLAERMELLEVVSSRGALSVGANPPDAEVADVASVAGRFRVVRAVLEPGALSLREILLDRMKQALAGMGVRISFATTETAPSEAPALDTLMDAFHATYPEHGLLLAVDDLSDFLHARPAVRLAADLEFLEELTSACRRLKFRFIASAQAHPAAHPSPSQAEQGFRRLRGLFAEITLGGRDLHFVAAHRLVRKTPGQRALVSAHLAWFARFYGGMEGRLGEFVDLFPLHPDTLPYLARGDFPGLGGALQTLSRAVAERLDDTVTTDAPGLIAFDHCWPALRDELAHHPKPETAALLRFSRQLEDRLAPTTAPAGTRELTRRLLHALCVRRLTAGDPYSECGLSAAELRDALCLYQPGLDAEPGGPAELLRIRVEQALEEIRQAAGTPLVTVRCHAHRYELHFRKFLRFNKPELFLHWVNAAPFLLLMLTGGIMLGSRFSHLDRQMFTWTLALHKACALTWLCALPLTILSRPRTHWAHLNLLFRWGPKDAEWMIQSLRSLYNKAAVIPPAGRFNTGQKINACLVGLYYFGFVATGLLMFAKGTILFPWYLHTALFFAAMGSVGGHLFLALINPSTRIAIAGIFHGWAPMKYIEHHHALSLPKSLHAHAHRAGTPKLTAALAVSRMELVILVVTGLLAGTGAYAFGLGRMATVKNQFAESFADIIQPSQLTTKHRLGPTAESCLKCHLLKGEIPDWKCEQCHQDVKARRGEQRGYHGSLKGDCRFCHHEHHEQSGTLVPLQQTKFDHNEALFKLTGKHAEAKCDDCHKRPRAEGQPGIYYLGLPHEQCADCHRDQHTGQFTAKCETCHRSPASWTGPEMTFRHATGSNFALEGKHASVDCRKCHQPATPAGHLGTAKFKGLARECAGCHEDPHRQQFATRCADCHSPAGWSGPNLAFNHNTDSKFPLTGQHAQVTCAKCHPPARAGDPLGRAQFRGLKTACADCHQDPHRGQFARDCTKCHATPDTWKVSAPLFEHNRDTKFVLQGKHAAVQCLQCHQPRPTGGPLASAKFTGLATSCETCHSVQHPAPYGPACTACHTADAWPPKQPIFDHRTNFGFELVGRHLLAKCSACHNPAIVGVRDHSRRTPFACATCHQKDDPHQGSLGESCAKCHSSIGWKGEDLLFDHNSMARFALDRDHVNVACVKCHENGRWKPVDPACANCHTKFFLDSRRSSP